MGAAPSSEVLAQAPFCSPGAGARQIALLPMTREFFPSADCTLFRQLYEARIDPSVRYYVRHKLNVLAQDVIPPFPCTREELYKWYVYYTPRLCYPSNAALRADAAAGCLHRIHPVPCAVVFLYRGAAHHMPDDCVPLVHRDNMYVKVVGGIADVQPFLASIGEEGPADKPARQERTLQMQMFITKSAGDHNMAHVVLLAAYIYQHQCLDLIGLPRMPSHGVAFKNYQTNIPFLCFLRELRDRTASLLDAAEAVRLWLDGPLIRGYVPAACMARLFDAFTQHYVAFVEAKTNQRLLKAQGQQQQMQQQMQQHVQQPQQQQQQQVAPTAIVAAASVPTPPLREMSLSQPPQPPQQQRPLMSSDDENEDEQEEEDENSVMDMLDKAVMAAQDEVATQLAAEAEENAMTRTVAATGHDVGQHGMLGTAKEGGAPIALQQQPIIITSTSTSQAQPQHSYCYCPQPQAAHNNHHNTTISTSSNGGNKCCCDGSSGSTDAHAVCICAPALCACGPDLGTLTEESNSLSTTLVVTTTQSASANAKPQSPPLISCHTNSMAGATQSGRPEQTMSARSAFASVTPQPSLTRQTSSSTITTTTATAVTNTNGTAGAAAEGGMRLAKMTPADTAVLAVVNNARIVPPARKQSYTVKGYIVGPEAVIPDYCDALDGVYVVCTDSEVHVCHGAMAPFAGISSASVCPDRAASPCGTRRESGVSTEAEGTHNEAQQQQQRQAEAHAGSHTSSSSSSLAAQAAAATGSKEEDKEASAEACRVVMTLQVRKGDILSFTPHEGNTNNSCSSNSHEDVKAAIATATTAITADTHTRHEDRPGGEQQQQQQEDKGHQDTSDQAAHTTTTITNTTAAAAELSHNSNTTTTGAAAAGDDAHVQQQPQQQTTSSSNSVRTTDTTTYDLSKLRYGSWRVDPSVYLESVLLSMVSDECRRAREAGPEHANWVRDPTTHNLVHDDNFYIWRFIRNGQAYYYGTVPHFASIHKRGGTLRASQMGHLNLSHHSTNGSSAAYARPPPHHHRSHLAAQQQQQQQRQQQQRAGNQAHLHAMHASHMAFLHAQQHQQQQQQRVMQENEARQAMMYLDGGYNSAAGAAATKVYAYDMLPSLQQQQQQQQQVMMMMQRLSTAPAAQPLPLLPQQPQQQQHVAFSPAAAAANTTTALAPSPFMTEAHPFARGAMPLPAMQAFLPQPTFFTPAPTITITTNNSSNTCARVGSHSAAAEYEAMSSMSSGHTSSAAALMSNAAVGAGAGSTHGSGYPLMPIPPPPLLPPTGTTHTPVQQQPQPHALLHPSAPLSASSSSPFASPADLTPATLRPHHSHHHNNNTMMTTTASSSGCTTQGNGLSGVLSAGAPAAAAAPAQYVLVHTNGLPTGPVTPLPQAAAGLHAPSSHNIANTNTFTTTTTAAGNAAAAMMMPLTPQQRTQPQQQPPPYGNAERVMSHTPLTAPTNTPAATTGTSAAAAAGPMMMSTGYVTGASAMHADMMAAQTHRTTPHPPTPPPPPSSSIAGPAMMMPYTPSTAATSAAAAHKEPGTTSNTMYYIVRTDGQPRLTTLQQTAHGLTPVLMPTTPHPFASPHNSTTTTHGTMAAASAAAAAGGEGGGNASQAATRPVYVVVHDSAANMSIPQRSHNAQPASSTVGPHSLASQAAALSAPGSHAHNMNSTPVAVGGEGMMMRPSQQEMAVQQGQTPYAMMLSLAPPPPLPSQQQQQQPPTTNAAQHAMMMMPTTSTSMMGGNAMPMTKNGREDEAGLPVNAMTSVLDMNAPASRPGQQQQQQQQQQQHFAQPAYVCYQDATRQPMAVSGVNGCYIMPGSTPPSASAAAASSMLLQQQQQQAMHADMSAMYLMR